MQGNLFSCWNMQFECLKITAGYDCLVDQFVTGVAIHRLKLLLGSHRSHKNLAHFSHTSICFRVFAKQVQRFEKRYFYVDTKMKIKSPKYVALRSTS